MEIETTRVDTFGQGCRKYRFAFSRAPFFQFAVFGGNLEQSPSYHINKIIALHNESKLSTYQKSHIPTPVVSAYQVWILTFSTQSCYSYVRTGSISFLCFVTVSYNSSIDWYLVPGTRYAGNRETRQQRRQRPMGQSPKRHLWSCRKPETIWNKKVIAVFHQK